MKVDRLGGAAICLVAASLSELSPAETPPPAASASSTQPSVAAAPTSASSAQPSVPAPASSTDVPAASASASAPILSSATGTSVDFESDRPLVSVFVAPGIIVDTTPRDPDPFVKVGRTPVATKLAPGVYTVTAESPDIAVGSKVFRVGTEPVHVRVRAGNADMRNLGTLLLGVGAASLLAVIAVEVSYSSAPTGISKSKIVVPLLMVGGLGVGSGLLVYFSWGTTIVEDGPKPDRRDAFVGVTSRW